MREVPVDLSVAEGLPEPPRGTRRLVPAVVRAVLRAEGWGAAGVSVHLGDDDLLGRLNRTYRGAAGPTDVLSFGLLEPPPAPGSPPRRARGRGLFLGDVVLSVPRALRQAEAFGHAPLRELCYLAAHGALHLLGYDDADAVGEAAMHARVQAALRDVGVGR